MTNLIQDIDKWNKLPWNKFQQILFRLQTRLYKARKTENLRLVRKIQKLILSSKSAKYLAIKQILKLNQKQLKRNKIFLQKITNLCQFADLINLKDWNPQPLKRQWIYKLDGTKHYFTVPTIYDTICQHWITYAVEPECEAYFNENHYGFRPGKTYYNVQKIIYNKLKTFHNLNKEYKILEINLEKCFDKISHKIIMQRINLPRWAKIKIWKSLKAGIIIEYPMVEKTHAKFPSVLANLLLHDFENLGEGLRYADHCIFLITPNFNLMEFQLKINQFLTQRGLSLKTKQTKLVTITEGFEFMGFKFSILPSGKFNSVPTTKNYQNLKNKIKNIIRDKRFTLEERLKNINLIVRIWQNYYKYCNKKKSTLWYIKHNVWKYVRHEIRRNKRIRNKRLWTSEKIKKTFSIQKF